MAQDHLFVEIAGGVATLTLNRPEALNALSPDMSAGLREQALRLEHDPSVRVVLIRGAGKHFMAGGDVKNFATVVEEPAEAIRLNFATRIGIIHEAVEAFRRMPKPVVASVQGAAAGFGMSLMLACDLAIAADTSFYTLAYVKIGVSPDGGSTYALPRVVGLRRALELALLGDRIDAQTALQYGIVNRVVPEADLERETRALVERLAAGPTHVYGNTKRLLQQALDTPLSSQLQAEAVSFAECASRRDFAEGVRSFVEKRRPAFTGE